MTLTECIEWAQDPIQECAGSPIIPASRFETLSIEVATYEEVSLTESQVLDLFKEQSKRFTACGANSADRFGVLRRNPKNGWTYLVELLTK